MGVPSHPTLLPLLSLTELPLNSRSMGRKNQGPTFRDKN